MRRTRELLKPSGALVFEAPNIATLTQRVRFLMGRSPLPDYSVYLDSAYPFTGHNREMTVGEVRHLLADAGFNIERLTCYDYVLRRTLSIKGKLLRTAKHFLPGNLGESILVLVHPLPVIHELA